MIKHVWTVLCERISTDQSTNLFSYLTCVEGINFVQLPASKQPLAIGVRWQKDGAAQETLKFRIYMVKPDLSEQVIIDSSEQPVANENYRTNVVLDGLVFEQPGIHIFRVEQFVRDKRVVVSEIPLRVHLLKTEN